MPKISCIIPTLNAQDHLGACLRSLRPGAEEIIVADGASTDNTRAIAQDFGARFISSARGRGVQCNAGAKAAGGDVLAFIHADSLLGDNALATAASAFEDGRCQLAKFTLGFDHDHWLLRASSWCARFDSLWTSFGDQGIVIRRSFFDELGGFKDMPLFEDVDLFRRARRKTKIRLLPAPVVTSARKFKEGGVIRQQLKNGWLIARYLGGASPEKLYESYYA
jgi:rSAM/selenodomain-associated transferase 2